MQILTFDYETFWNSKSYTLSKMGPLEYVRASEFDAQLLGLSVNGQPAQVYQGKDTPQVLSQFDMDNDVFVGHNAAGFDTLILSEHFGLRPKHVWDTIFAMRWTGLSSISSETHKALTALLGNGEKKDGTVVSDGKSWPQDFTIEEQAFFVHYCADDVNQCAANMRSMLPYMTADALQFMSITARMATEPVFVLDEKLLEEFIRQLDQEAEEARQKIMEVFHFENLQMFFKAIRSADKFASMLRELGVEPPTKFSAAKTATARQRINDEISRLRPDQVDELAIFKKSLSSLDARGISTYAFSKTDIDFLALREHDDPRVRLLVETRLEMNSSILRSRAETLLKFARQRKPIPIMLSAFKARTGRYSAGSSDGSTDRMQFQNLSKRNPAHLPLRRAIKAPAGMKVVAVDSSQVEARVLAYEANHYELLDHFRQGRDPYAELAVNFDRQYSAQAIHNGAKSGDKHCKQLRNVAKILVLACLGPRTEVLTDRGWKFIEFVSLQDKLWDGQEWVSHDGVVRRGLRGVIRLGALVLTPEHQLWNNQTKKWVAARDITKATIDDFNVDIPVHFDYIQKHRHCPKDDGRFTGCEQVYDILNSGPRHCFTIRGRNRNCHYLSHNCGYGTSAQKFSDTLLRQGMKLAADTAAHAEKAHEYHAIYRASNFSIVQFWRTAQSIIEALVVGGSGKFGGPNGNLFEYGVMPIIGRTDLAVPSIRMPNGFCLRYPNLRMTEGENGRIEYVYDAKLGKNIIPKRLYGAGLVENLTQSLAFHILIWQACRMDSAGIALKGNNHDCWYTVVSDHEAQATYDKMMWHMKQVPSWAAGCPIDCDGEIGDDFRVC